MSKNKKKHSKFGPTDKKHGKSHETSRPYRSDEKSTMITDE